MMQSFKEQIAFIGVPALPENRIVKRKLKMHNVSCVFSVVYLDLPGWNSLHLKHTSSRTHGCFKFLSWW